MVEGAINVQQFEANFNLRKAKPLVLTLLPCFAQTATILAAILIYCSLLNRMAISANRADNVVRLALSVRSSLVSRSITANISLNFC